MNLLKKLQRSCDFWFLLATSLVFFLLRLPSFFEPYWYGDEGVYEVLGFGMRHGRLLYQGVWDNKPPLLYLIYALFDGNQPYVRIFSFIVGLVAIYFFFVLCKLLFENKKSVYTATAFFAIFLGLPLIEGNIANAENFMVLPTVMAFYYLVKTIQEKKYNLVCLFGTGVLLGISLLIKVVAVFDFATAFLLIGFILFAWSWKILPGLIAKLATFSIGFFLPLALTVGFFLFNGILKTFVQSAFSSNVGYVNYGNQFIIPQGFLILKLLLLALVLLFIFVKRKSFSLSQLLIYMWVPFALFDAFFSQRPYTHYMLTILASASLLLGIIFEKKLKILHAIFFIFLIFILSKNFWFYSKTVEYYKNFLSFVAGKETIASYQSFFDKSVPRDYAIADFLRMNVSPNQNIFLWTNSAQEYYLVGKLPPERYTVAYHITASTATLNETSIVFAKAQPGFVVILPDSPPFPFRMTDYRLRVDIQGGLIYERIF